jgi:hypothetical protein
VLNEPLNFALLVLPVASLAGLASLLRSERDLNWRSVASAMINSGLFGTSIAMFGYNKWDIWLLLSLSILSGLGGNALVDFVIDLIKLWAKKYVNNGK